MLEAPGDDELRHTAPRAIGALLVASGLLRVGAVGVGVAVQFRLSDLADGRPSGVDIGLVGAAQAVTEMVFAPILARYADRFGRRRLPRRWVRSSALSRCCCVALGVRPAQLGRRAPARGSRRRRVRPGRAGDGRRRDLRRSPPPRGRQRCIRGVNADRVCGRVRARLGRLLRTPPRGVRPARGVVRVRGSRVPRLRSARPAAAGALAARRSSRPPSGRDRCAPSCRPGSCRSR